MQLKMLPLNIDLLVPSKQDLQFLSEIKVLDITDGLSKNFHPSGLFSTEIFGKSGEEKRNRLFAYIDLKISVFHPAIFYYLCELKALYGEIMSGKSYAIFNETTKDFDKADAVSGYTGYNFFLKHFKELKFEENDSPGRKKSIEVINKNRENCLIDKLIVMPAGLRDYEIVDGKPTEDEINALYRKVLNITFYIKNINVSINNDFLDSARINMQNNINAIFDYIINMLDGKNKYIQGRWASRKIYDSTRNVITSVINDTSELLGPRCVSTNQTVVGLHQFLRSTLPLSQGKVRNLLSDIFIGPTSPAILINKKTLKKETVVVRGKTYDDFMSNEGLEKLFAKFGQESIRHEPLEAEGYYLGLIYKGLDSNVKFVQDIDSVPEHIDKNLITPITMAELFYLAVHGFANTIPCYVTRYPITSYGSIYPSFCYLRTTTKSELRYMLNDQWERTGEQLLEFPVVGKQFFNSIAPHHKHLGRLGADFDGDTGSFTCVWSREAIEEAKRIMDSAAFYVDVNGKMSFSANTDILSVVMKSMTGRGKK